jgi:hypothetical protein
MMKFVWFLFCVLALAGLVSADSFTVGDSIRFLSQGMGSLILQVVASGDYFVVFFFLFILFMVLVAFLVSVFMLGVWVMKKVIA